MINSVYKMNVMTFKYLHGIVPVYSINLRTLKPSRGRWSDDQMLLVVPRSKLVTYVDTSFSPYSYLIYGMYYHLASEYVRVYHSVSQYSIHICSDKPIWMISR